jgi:hypothetical protein
MTEGDSFNNSTFLNVNKLSSSSQTGSSIFPSIMITKNMIYSDGSFHEGYFTINVMF